jgi:hypothetical protein
MIKYFHENKEQLQRDEAILSSSLAVIPPMFGTANRDWDTYSLTGFDPKAVSKILEVDESHIPEMLLIVNYR